MSSDKDSPEDSLSPELIKMFIHYPNVNSTKVGKTIFFKEKKEDKMNVHSDKDSPEVSLSPEATVLRLLSLEFASLFDLSPIFCKIPSSSQRTNFPLKIVPSIIQAIWKHFFWIRCDRPGKDMRCKSDGPDENGIDMWRL